MEKIPSSVSVNEKYPSQEYEKEVPLHTEETRGTETSKDGAFEQLASNAVATFDAEFDQIPESRGIPTGIGARIAEDTGIRAEKTDIEHRLQQAALTAQHSESVVQKSRDRTNENETDQSIMLRARRELEVVTSEWPRTNIGGNMERIHSELRDLTLFADREFCFSVGRKEDSSVVTLTGIGAGLQTEIYPELLQSQMDLKYRAAKALGCREIIDVHTHPQKKTRQLLDQEHDVLVDEQIRREKSGELAPLPHPPSSEDIHSGLAQLAEQIFRARARPEDAQISEQFIADATGIWGVRFQEQSPIYLIIESVAKTAWQSAATKKSYITNLAKSGIDLLSPPEKKVSAGASPAEIEEWWDTVAQIECAKQEAGNMFSDRNWKSYLDENRDTLAEKSIDVEGLIQHGTIGGFADYGFGYSKPALQKLMEGDNSLQVAEQKAKWDLLQREMEWKKGLGIIITHHPYHPAT